MALVAAAVLFVIYAGNVVLGALIGSPILSDVQEMLVLLAASIAFVIGILRCEKDAAEEENQKN